MNLCIQSLIHFNNKKFLLIFIVLLSFFSCSYEVPKQKKSYLYVHDEVEINFLIYMAGDNNLERFGIQNIKALQEVGSSAKERISEERV